MNIEQFDRAVVRTGRPVVVDFWAPWCAPCRITKPVLEKLSREFSGRVDFLPVNADESAEILQKFKVFGIPTVLAMRDGQVAARVTGARDEAAYRSMFEALATGAEVRLPLRMFDRVLRLGLGGLLLAWGISNGSWLAMAGGAVVAFMGVHDRCPVWAAITRVLRSSRA